MFILKALLSIAFYAAALYFIKKVPGLNIFESPQKRAGRRGEAIATAVIRRNLREDDTLLTNVPIICNGKESELDDLIINEHGVFIVEVKNYVGEMYGTADDYEWTKVKSTYGGNEYEKPVRNPIKQMKRQEYILSQLLRENGINVWVQGYVYFVNHNSPVNDSCVLNTDADIDYAIHGNSRMQLSPAKIAQIVSLLQKAA